MIKCSLCDKDCADLKSLSRHITHFHNIDKKEYYDKFLKEENEGICKVCGKPTNFKSISYGYTRYCGSSCANSNPETKERKRLTNLEKYGYENPMQSKEIQKKHRNTCLDKYGCENVFQSERIKEKIKNTNLEKYGVENPSSSEDIKQKKIKTCKNNFGVMYPMQSKEVQNKSKKTCKEKYGVENVSQCEEIKNKKAETTLKNYGEDNPFKSETIKERIKETNLKTYGVENPSSSEDIKEKKYATTFAHYGVTIPYKSREIFEKGMATMKENGSYYKSKPEEELYKLLCDKFGEDDVERQHREDRYPFNCDFYIRSIDTFIELNAYWTHGDHFFDENDPEDLDMLNLWKDKSNYCDFYARAVESWTNHDLNKKKTAEDNGINYLVFWECDLSDAKEWLNSI